MTIQGANINPRVPQCKNCWKWEYSTFIYQAQESKCIKCNSLHKSEHYWHFTWCCKMNFKINPDWRWNRGNHASTLLNISTAKVIIKPTLTFAHSGSITSTESSIQRSIKNSVIVGTNQFTQLWMAYKYDCKESQSLFTKCLKEQTPHWHIIGY